MASSIVVLGSLGLPVAASGLLEPAGPAVADAGTGLEAASASLDAQLEAAPSSAVAERLVVQQAQLETVRALLPLIEDVDHLDTDKRGVRALDVADVALAERTALVEDRGPDAVADGLEQQALTLDATREIVGTHRAGTSGGLSEAIAHVATVSARQAAALGLDADAAASGAHAPAMPAFSTPSEAVEAIAERQDVALSASASEDVAALDALDAPTRSALTDVLAAYVAFDAAVQTAFDDIEPTDLHTHGISANGEVSPDALERLAVQPPGNLATPADHAEALGLDLTDVLSARAQLLDQVDRLDRVLDERQSVDRRAPDPVRVPGAVAIDLAGGATTYTEDYAFQLDVGGDDTYLNNAGGSNLDGGGCSLEETAGAATLIDLDGDDAYGSAELRRGCGANGGAYTGAGVLVDAAGTDRFIAGGAATNGGALAEGLGLLVAVGGDDVFDAYAFGTNGGGNEALGALVSVDGSDDYLGGSLGSNGAATGSGVGVLVDTGGADVYDAGIIGANGAGDGYILGTGVGMLVDLGEADDVYASSGGNGGGSRKGVGFLYDGGGDDRFLAHAFGTNGGGHAQGVGTLVSGGGSDVFEADYTGANGGATSQGVGVLVNLGSGSTYGIHDHHSAVRPGTQGFNGGANDGAVALVVDAGGGSHFEGDLGAVNGGASDDGVSLMITGEGDDVFEADGAGANGGASAGTALLVDLGGADLRVAEDGGVNGGAEDEGVAGLVDLGGDDTYTADGRGSNGGADDGGHGLLIDRAGDDTYLAGSGGANGHADALSYGLLLDGSGMDYYEDGEGGTGWDKTVVPKGAIGAQVDEEGPA